MELRLPGYLAIAVAGTALVGCGSTNSSSSQASTTRSPSEQAGPQIKKVWTEFFSPSTTASTKVALLQNGQQFAPVINAQAKSPLAKESAAQVSEVKLQSPETAIVTYTVTLAGKPALKNTTGTAVKSGSNWLVSVASFCQLLTLEGSAPPSCPKG
jgi:hypothetical protein